MLSNSITAPSHKTLFRLNAEDMAASRDRFEPLSGSVDQRARATLGIEKIRTSAQSSS